mmetsp:Transcript_18114/g.43496  ORF Transcript_18114/g.43496 Transcript_18114/m.43496 type:complete len:225 (-) Transcript_18114:2217-2891(-)
MFRKRSVCRRNMSKSRKKDRTYTGTRMVAKLPQWAFLLAKPATAWTRGMQASDLHSCLVGHKLSPIQRSTPLADQPPRSADKGVLILQGQGLLECLPYSCINTIHALVRPRFGKASPTRLNSTRPRRKILVRIRAPQVRQHPIHEAQGQLRIFVGFALPGSDMCVELRSQHLQGSSSSRHQPLRAKLLRCLDGVVGSLGQIGAHVGLETGATSVGRTYHVRCHR